MLEAVISDNGARSIAAIARQLGVPIATAHRQVHSLIQEGFLARHERGFHAPGPRLLRLLGSIDESQAVANAAAPILHRLASDLSCVAQLGTLDGDMVTYRIKTGQAAGDLFTRIGMQLEAYCSGMGKVLLAALPEREREAYLAAGPFPALTERTITEPALLRAELARVRAQGYAVDDGEIAQGLYCTAVPIHMGNKRVCAAISASRQSEIGKVINLDRQLKHLRQAAQEIEIIAARALAAEAAPH